MLVEKKDGGVEKLIVTALITSKDVLSQIAPLWQKQGLFKNQWCNLVGGWCVRHYLRYNEPPGKNIESIYERWASNGADKATAGLVERFISGLSGEYKSRAKSLDTKYILDTAEDYFNKVQLAKFKETLEEDLDDGKTAEAIKRVHSFVPLKMGESATVNVLTDSAAIIRAFEAKPEPIIQYKGSLGQFFDTAFALDSLVAFVGPEKSGKSFVLLDIAWRSMMQRNKTAMFIIGDMSEEQVMLRFMVRASCRPLRPTRKGRPVRYPTSISHDPESKYAEIEHDEREYADELDWRVSKKAMEKIIQTKVKSNDPYLRLSCHPGGGLNIFGVESILAQWDRQGWSPNVVVIDYADNLAPIDGKVETRHQVDATWMAMKGISQKRKCLVVTATQSNAAGYGAYLLTKKHFSESKRKNAHVTAMIGINQHEEEYGNDTLRLNMIALRGEEANVSRCCFVASCRSIANIAVRSTW